MEQTSEMTALELKAEIMRGFQRVPSCRDIRAEYLQIMPLKPKGPGPNWIASIDLPMSDLAKAEARAVIDGVRGRYALKQG
jgi:hypothetical protein